MRPATGWSRRCCSSRAGRARQSAGASRWRISSRSARSAWIKAIDRFDLDRGVELTTYAVPTIVGEIRRHFRDKAWALHVPRRLKELNLKVGRLLDELTSDLGRSPTIAEPPLRPRSTRRMIDALESRHAYSARPLRRRPTTRATAT